MTEPTPVDEPEKEVEPLEAALQSIARNIVVLSKVINNQGGVIDRIAWMIAQDYAGDYMASIDPRVVMSQKEMKRRCDDIIKKVQQFIYNGDMQSLVAAAETISKERKASKIII